MGQPEKWHRGERQLGGYEEVKEVWPCGKVREEPGSRGRQGHTLLGIGSHGGWPSGDRGGWPSGGWATGVGHMQMLQERWLGPETRQELVLKDRRAWIWARSKRYNLKHTRGAGNAREGADKEFWGVPSRD